MLIGDLLLAAVLLGLPLALLSWLLFTWLFASGDLDRTANRKNISSRIKEMKQARKGKKKERRNFIYDRWMWFGSEFYGLAGLYTFFAMEVSQLFTFIFYFPGVEYLLRDGVIALIFNVLVNQLQNVILAFVWFSFWPADSILLWVLIAYLGYWVGVELARREQHNQLQQWLEKSPTANQFRQRLVRFLPHQLDIEKPQDSDQTLP